MPIEVVEIVSLVTVCTMIPSLQSFSFSSGLLFMSGNNTRFIVYSLYDGSYCLFFFVFLHRLFRG